MVSALATTSIPGLALFRRGKVRDTYRLPDGGLLMVATDRVSAFDAVMPTPIPDKGRVLTQMSRWWFARTADVTPNHLRDDDPISLPAQVDWAELGERSMRVVAAERIDIECVVRGYLAGSGWKEYREQGTLAEETLPAGLRESARFPQPRFTPAAKNDEGHDENISRARLADVVGAETAALLEQRSLALYAEATRFCAEAGMILADTKFEFGWVDGELTLIDEVLTPDSSRFWDATTYREGEAQPAFDKQYLRDWLEASGWNKQPPGPELPADVVAHTRARYLEAARRICGLELS
ncbi:MAG TPA: phosphoribosylaminoimidazolesuccinocarboxamide synthase [Candidatus Dormibacteraeota bacterium]